MKPIEETFSLKTEIQKMEESERRDLNIIAFYLSARKPDIQSKAQLSVAIKRHIRAAKELSVFSDEQIQKALNVAEKEYGKIFTIETLIKILCK